MVGASADAGARKINEAGLRVLLRLAPLQDPKLLGVVPAFCTPQTAASAVDTG